MGGKTVLRKEAILDLDNYGPVPVRDYDYVVCSKCGSEFQPHVKECIDCGAPTVPPGTVQPRARAREDEREPEARPLSQAPELVVLSSGSFETIEELREALDDEEIPSWIEPTSARLHADSFRLYVQRRDARRAHDLERELIQEAIPEGEQRFTDLPAAGVCPVCRAVLPAGTLECPGCGLVLAQAPPPTAGNVETVQSLYAALAARDEVRILDLPPPGRRMDPERGLSGRRQASRRVDGADRGLRPARRRVGRVAGRGQGVAGRAGGWRRRGARRLPRYLPPDRTLHASGVRPRVPGLGGSDPPLRAVRGHGEGGGGVRGRLNSG